MARKVPMPESIGGRPTLPHNRYSLGSQPLTIDGVDVKFGTNTKNHVINAPTGEGHTSRTLRRFGMILSRYKLPDIKKRAKQWKVSEGAVESTGKVFSHKVFRDAFGYDATVGTVSTELIVNLLNEPNPSKETFVTAFSLTGTGAMREILDKVVDPELKDFLEMRFSAIDSRLRWAGGIKYLNSKDSYYRRYAMRDYRDLAKDIDLISEHAQSKFGAKPKPKEGSVRREGERGNPHRNLRDIESDDGGGGWFPLFVCKPELPLNHVGMLGRRNTFTDSGAVIRDVNRWYTDPSRRIFRHRSRSLGAVIVADCSGSMGLDENDLSRLMSMSAGATVLCYSSGMVADLDHPNAWVVARNGRQVRSLPEFPGGNGCDGPALRYAVRKLRHSALQPVIWISDQRVTGNGDRHDRELLRECQSLVKTYGIRVVENLDEAQQLLRTLQGKA